MGEQLHFEPVYFELPNAAIVEVSGRHATRYLNNRFTNDVSKLATTAVQMGSATIRAGALNAQGRLEGLFTVVATSAEPTKFILVCDAGRGDAEFLAALARYKVADDVQFKARDDLKLIHSGPIHAGLIHTGPSHTAHNLTTIIRSNASYADAITDSSSSLVLASWSRNRGLKDHGLKDHVLKDHGLEGGKDFLVPADYTPSGIQLDLDSATKLRIASGEPQFGIDFDSDALLAEICLVDAVSFTKGCYVGQEVVARVDALGKPPRLLLRGAITGTGPLTDFAVTITAPAPGGRKRTVGEVTTVIQAGDRLSCFVMLRNDDELLKSDQLRVDSRLLTIQQPAHKPEAL